MPSKRSNELSKNVPKAPFEEKDIVLFLRDLFHDISEQTQALKNLSEAYKQLHSTSYTRNDQERYWSGVKEHFGVLFQKVDRHIDTLAERVREITSCVERIAVGVEDLRSKVYTKPEAEKNLQIVDTVYGGHLKRIEENIKEVQGNISGIGIVAAGMGERVQSWYNLVDELIKRNKTDTDFAQKMREMEIKHSQEMEMKRTEITQARHTSRMKLISQVVSYILGASGLLYLILSNVL